MFKKLAIGVGIGILAAGAVALPASADTIYPIYWDHDEVTGIKQGIDNVNDVCRFVPLPYLAGLGCGASETMEDAIVQAYWQGTGVTAYYHDCGFNYCSYYTYEVG